MSNSGYPLGVINWEGARGNFLGAGNGPCCDRSRMASVAWITGDYGNEGAWAICLTSPRMLAWVDSEQVFKSENKLVWLLEA